jgi:hypothetical protein
MRRVASKKRDAVQVQNVWAYLRANKLCNLVWNAYDDIVKACAAAWHFIIQNPERIQSIGKRDWARVSQ